MSFSGKICVIYDGEQAVFPASIAEAVQFDQQSLSDYLSIKRVQQSFKINPWYDMYQLAAHRGTSGYPENTIPGYKQAIKLGFKILECDIAFSSDNIAVLSHDATIDRCCTGHTGSVSNYTAAQLASFDFGTKTGGSQFSSVGMPTLEDFLLLCKKYGVIAELDCATPARFPDSKFEQVYNLVQKLGMEGSTIFTDTAERLYNYLMPVAQFNNFAVICSISGITSTSSINNTVLLINKMALRTDCSVPKANLTQALIDTIHSYGMTVKTWTVNTSSDLQNVLNMGADHVLTDSLSVEKPEDLVV